MKVLKEDNEKKEGNLNEKFSMLHDPTLVERVHEKFFEITQRPENEQAATWFAKMCYLSLINSAFFLMDCCHI